MPKRSKKPKKNDVNQMAADILAKGIGELTETTSTGEKNPAAVALGRMGGLKGGKARAKNLAPEQLAEIGKKGAAARWKDRKTNAQPETSISARSSRQKLQKKKRRAVIQVQED